MYSALYLFWWKVNYKKLRCWRFCTYCSLLPSLVTLHLCNFPHPLSHSFCKQVFFWEPPMTDKDKSWLGLTLHSMLFHFTSHPQIITQLIPFQWDQWKIEIFKYQQKINESNDFLVSSSQVMPTMLDTWQTLNEHVCTWIYKWKGK